MLLKENFNVDYFNSWGQKVLFDFGNQMNFGHLYRSNKSPRVGNFECLVNSPAIIVPDVAEQTEAPARGSRSNLTFLSSYLEELRDRINLLLQEKEAGNVFQKKYRRNIAMTDN